MNEQREQRRPVKVVNKMPALLRQHFIGMVCAFARESPQEWADLVRRIASGDAEKCFDKAQDIVSNSG